MADHEEQLSDEEKVRCQFHHEIDSNGGREALEFCVAFESVCPRILTSTGVIECEENPGLSTTTAASALIIFSSTSAHLRISNGGSLYGPDSK